MAPVGSTCTVGREKREHTYRATTSNFVVPSFWVSLRCYPDHYRVWSMQYPPRFGRLGFVLCRDCGSSVPSRLNLSKCQDLLRTKHQTARWSKDRYSGSLLTLFHIVLPTTSRYLPYGIESLVRPYFFDPTSSHYCHSRLLRSTLIKSSFSPFSSIRSYLP